MPPPLIIAAAVVLAVILLIVIIFSLRVTITFAYSEDGFRMFIKPLFFKINIYPFKEKRKKHRVRSMSVRKARRIRRQIEKRNEINKKLNPITLIKNALSTDKKPKTETEKPTVKKPVEQKKSDIKFTADDAKAILDLLRLMVELSLITVKQFSKRLRIKVARLRVKIASPDAAVTAISYGAATQTVNVLLPILSEVKNFKIPKKKDFDVTADFTSDKPEVDIEISFSLRLWHFLDIPRPAIGKAIVASPRYIDLVLEKLKDENDSESDKSPDKTKK